MKIGKFKEDIIKKIILGIFMALSLTLFSSHTFAEEKLTVQAVDTTLVEMGFSSEEVKKISEKTKKQIVESGGEKADYTVEDVTLTYQSLDGKVYEVTDANKNEIALMEKKDRKIAQLIDPLAFAGIDEEQFREFQTFSSGFNDRAEGDWYGSTYITKVGATSTNNIYEVWTEWTWTNGPKAWWTTDTVATAWDIGFTAQQNSDKQYRFVVRRYADGNIRTDNINDLKILHDQYGHQAKVPIGTFLQQSGGISEKLLINKSVKGTKGLLTVYAHPTTPLGTSATIGPVSIDFSTFAGYKWSYRLNINL
ncbi:hypothetical protein PZE06_22180 [Robertmurraya sp. DFI.2.37]|uniref:hypothetical protein n=1 Tax=Robertmurraya sp. DFI.2.37 TaxID=3031819 RepID=UPI0012448DC9|nr:hypothetical protein [Robertmurraya sp. DFI.2.37]MDF1510846.1 hypothetical protein [Robertmurraya sp. DFI.2.37]